MLPEALAPSARLPWEDGFQPEPAAGEWPGVTIVLPIYNAARFLERTVRSLACNDLSGVELIVVDGGSQDGTPAILDHYRDLFQVVISEPDRGQSDAINKGFRLASMPVLHWLNGDDLLLPNALNRVRQAFHEHPESPVIVGDAYMTELDLKPIHHFRFSAGSLRLSALLDYAKNHLVQPSVFFRREAWATCGPLDESLHYAMDADLFLSMAQAFEFLHLPTDIAYSVYHEDCKTRAQRAESIAELSLVQARHGGFDEARRTLDLLVDLYNESQKRVSTVPADTRGCERCRVLETKLKALENSAERIQRALLNADIQNTQPRR